MEDSTMVTKPYSRMVEMHVSVLAADAHVVCLYVSIHTPIAKLDARTHAHVSREFRRS